MSQIYTAFYHKKKWGQNFLKDSNVINKIIACLEPDINDEILEIGPGDGALTDKLYPKVSKLHVVEIDPHLIAQLKTRDYPNVRIHAANILTWDLGILTNNVKIIGNLPYYISSPILFRLLETNKWSRMTLMFQKEVAHRIVSKPNSKSYGRLSVMCQVYCDVKSIFTVSKHVFKPKPNVDSSVLVFLPKKMNLPNINQFSEFIKQAFSKRRKKLKNNLPELYNRGVLKEWADNRPEEITPDQYVKIYLLI